MNSDKYIFRCENCGKTCKQLYTCPDCGEIKGVLNVVYDYASLRMGPIILSYEDSIFRYLPLLPINKLPNLPLKVKMTPLVPYNVPDLQVWLKLDIFTPSLSFKDRASSVVTTYAVENKIDTLITASTGNAATSLSCFTAVLGLKAIILVPKSIPIPKLAQLIVMGAKVVLVDSNYDEIFDITNNIAAQNKGWLNRNTAINPFTIEGKKTVSFELWEQLRSKMPDYLVVPVGDGNIISGVWKGIKELQELGLIDRVPRLIGVQAEGCSPLVKAFYSNKNLVDKEISTTFADSIAVGYPRDQFRALRSVKASGGCFIAVEDSEILESIFLLGKKGIFVEPSAGAAMAGFLKLHKQKFFSTDSKVVVLLTGNGLKDTKPVTSVLKSPTPVDLNINAIISKIKEV